VLNHRCIRFRHRGESVYKWELDKGDESLTIAVNGSLLLDDVDLVIQAALDGAGLAWVTEDRIAKHLESGALIRVLEDWCPPDSQATARRSHGPHHHTPARQVTWPIAGPAGSRHLPGAIFALSTHQAVFVDFETKCNRYSSGQRITNVARKTVEGGPPRTCAGTLEGTPPWGPATEQRFPADNIGVMMRGVGSLGFVH
jgi:hypothetical protein